MSEFDHKLQSLTPVPLNKQQLVKGPPGMEARRGDPNKQKTEQVAKQFEAVLISTMVREMRRGSGLFEGSDPSSSMFDQLFDQTMAERMGESGFGLRKIVSDALERSQHKVSTTQPIRIKPLGKMSENVTQWDPLIEKISSEEGVDPHLVRAVIERESNGHPRAISRAGAMGLMQLMPDTARSLGVRKAFDPEENIRGGVRYLKTQLEKFGNVEHALAAYNAGPGAVERYGGIPPYRETQHYVAAIRSRLQLNALPPEEARDE